MGRLYSTDEVKPDDDSELAAYITRLELRANELTQALAAIEAELERVHAAA